jgi:hypothetical protein
MKRYSGTTSRNTFETQMRISVWAPAGPMMKDHTSILKDLNVNIFSRNVLERHSVINSVTAVNSVI